MRFCVVGDAALDVTVAPEQVVRPGGDVPARIRLSPGGQGANVAVGLARREADVLLVCAMADDVAGSILRAVLAGERVRLAPQPAMRTTTVVALLDGYRDRSMLSDRATLAVDEGLHDLLEGVDWIHCSGYPLLDDASGDALALALTHRRSGVRLSVAGGSIPPDPGRVAQLIERLATAGVDLLILGLDEATAMLGATRPAARAAATALLAHATIPVVTDGPRGSVAAVADRTIQVEAPSLQGQVVDATGSGDAYTAALVHELATGAWPPSNSRIRTAMEEASRAGALAVQAWGAQGRVEGEA